MMNPEDDENFNNYYEHLPADHPLLAKVQAAIEEKLKKEEESLRLRHKEKSEELKKIRRIREEKGINLFSLQQQYIKIEVQFSNKYEEFKNLEARRKENESRLAEETKLYNDKFLSVKEQQKMVMQSTEDLNQLNSMLKYVETYNLGVKSEIRVTRTTAIKVEENIKENEREKKEQDFFIDYLEGQIKTLTEKKLLYEAQLSSQKTETHEARANLAEAQKEIDNITDRKRALLKDWDKTVFSMKSKDKALQVVKESIDEQEEEKLKLTSQLGRYKDLIQNEIFKNNTLSENNRKLEMKKQMLLNSIKELKDQIAKQEEKRLYLETSINRTKNELEVLQRKEASLQNDINLIQKNKLKLLNEARVLSEKNILVLSSSETHEKQAENLTKLNNKLVAEIFEINVEIDAKLNEIARVEIDKLNVETQNAALAKKLELMDQEITKLEEEYNKRDKRIKQNHKALETKQLEMDKLNKDYGELTKNKGGEDEGLYEIKIKELNSENKKYKNLIQEKEQEWLLKKQDLVSKENLLNTISEECVDKRSKKMILEHKRIRLNKNYEIHQKEIREIEVGLKNLGYDMNKYNTLLGKNVDTKVKLDHQFFDVEIEFKEKLKQMENNSVKLELEIEVLREEKADTLTQIMEVERQIHLWERKIQLQEQMQAIIKPENGIKEIDEMKSFIHRQDLKYKKLKLEQEKVIKNMEMAIQRNEFIKVRYPVDRFGEGDEKNNTSGPMQREISELKDQAKHISNKKNEYMKMLQSSKTQYDEIAVQLEEQDAEIDNAQRNLNTVNNEYMTAKMKANNFFCKKKQNQDATRILEDFKTNKFRPRRKEDVEREIAKYAQENENLINVLKNFKDTHPEWASIFEEAMR